MTSTSFHKTLGRKLLATGVTLTVAAGLVATALLTGIGTSANDAASASAVSSDTTSVDSDVKRFRADLKEARELTGDARIEAVKKIRQDAKDGKYGDKVEKRIERRAGIWAHAPKELRADLKEVWKADASERVEKRHEIFVKALAGDYGDQAQKRAERLKEFVEGK
jgi:outer membrane murein-binding lipoprotein Lpp